MAGNLPKEIFVENLKFLSRKELLQKVQPVCKQFHVLCERAVPTKHMITDLDRFVRFLEENNPKARQQWARLESGTSDLSAHFCFPSNCAKIPIYPVVPGDLRIAQRRLVLTRLFRSSLQLFQPCNLCIIVDRNIQHNKPYYAECHRYLDRLVGHVAYTRLVHASNEFIEHPAIMQCAKIYTTFFNAWDKREFAAQEILLISKWLHHQPQPREHGHSERVLYLAEMPASKHHLLLRILENFKEAKEKCSFIIWIDNPEVASFAPCKFENERTQEKLEQIIWMAESDGHKSYLLRRCGKNWPESIEEHFHRLFVDDFEHIRFSKNLTTLKLFFHDIGIDLSIAMMMANLRPNLRRFEQ